METYIFIYTYVYVYVYVGRSGCTVWGVGLRPLVCWDRWFQIRKRHGCLSVVIVVCFQVEIYATIRSLVQRSPTGSGSSLCVFYNPQEWGDHGPRWAAVPQEKIYIYICIYIFVCTRILKSCGYVMLYEGPEEITGNP